MHTKIIEATNSGVDGINHGKFMLCRMLGEWSVPTALEEWPNQRSLLAACGWTPKHLWVMDLQTGEGALFHPGGFAEADLNKHRIWTCPLFPHFLEWLYTQDLSRLDDLPSLVDLNAPSALYGSRGAGPT